LLVKKLVTAKKAIKYYESLENEKSVNHYTEILKETEKKNGQIKEKSLTITA